jgi:isopentenyl diphosphate isomerase/L-lactate dehydrogenase-like FMN-dependent dehydrogenase
MKMEINIAMQLTGCQTMADVKQMQIKTTFA